MKVVLARTASHRVNDIWQTFQAGKEYELDEVIEKMVKLGKTEIVKEIPDKPEKDVSELDVPEPKPKKKPVRKKAKWKSQS